MTTVPFSNAAIQGNHHKPADPDDHTGLTGEIWVSKGVSGKVAC